MKHVLLFLIMLGPVAAFAMKCDEHLNCTGKGISKTDIKVLSERLKTHNFNGKPFSLKAIQVMFEKTAKIDEAEPADYGPYIEKKKEFDHEYGTSKEAKLLFDLAKADFYIKRFEKEHDFQLADDEALVTDYRFIGNSRRESMASLYEDTCILTAKSSGSRTNCDYQPESLLFLQNTSCIAYQPMRALVKTMEDGELVVYGAHYMARGESIRYDEHVWVKLRMREEARNSCSEQMNDLKKEVELQSCARYRPWEKKENKSVSQRSPAVVEIYSRKLKPVK